MTNTQIKDEIVRLLKSTKREYIEDVIDGLEELGFFEAPASTKFHLNEAGGLAEHSLNVCRVALMLRKQMIEMKPEIESHLPEDSVIIASLLHDVCKADIYKKAVKKRKNVYGVWEDYDGYEVDYSSFPLGHGEKSVIVVLRMGFDLSDEEIMAMRWHMSVWDLPFQSPDIKGNYNAAKEICPLCSLVQSADNLAANMLEYKENDQDLLVRTY